MAVKNQKPADQTPEVGPGTVGDDATTSAPAGPESSAPPVPPADSTPAAAAPASAADEADNGERKIITKVWAARGQVPKAAILQTAIQSVRNAIPVVFELEADITGATKTEDDPDKGTQAGTEFEVTITYTPRAVEGKDEQVDVDKVIRGLDVPRSFDGLGGHEGDPNFHDRKPTEF
ncbi:hypothetical protein [Mycobacterium sp. TY813]|uniref:hypothetical protein n=1 Tax=Mycobacterium TaxID=1763 RepID=UPI002742002E|nr:hypothetical protein [Mycobacterium sp. TY813]MDP7729511.1 hypothetical protein [Mycobacterium sp. TY813]